MLKLLALDEEDLQVISAHLQDAVVRVGDLAYLPSQKRFAAVLNRFDWEHDAKGGGPGKTEKFVRRRTALRFDRVMGSQIQNIGLKNKDVVLSLLAIQYEAANPEQGPEGHVTLTFAGGGAIRLDVEVIEAELVDLGGVWETSNRPEHPSE